MELDYKDPRFVKIHEVSINNLRQSYKGMETLSVDYKHSFETGRPPKNGNAYYRSRVLAEAKDSRDAAESLLEC